MRSELRNSPHIARAPADIHVSRGASLGEGERDIVVADGRSIKLAPGMNATVEIKTDQRRLIEYLLSPLLRYRQESLRER
jgi:multidrug efflux pump subunit AcrA (membrane-fusion protein)